MKNTITKSLWMLLIIIQSTYSYAQSNLVTGKITNNTGEALIGVTIVEKGTTNGAITDLEGIYTINLITPNAVLEFSYTGFKKKEIVANNPTIDVQMELDANTFDEIVITGIRGAQLREVSITRNANTVIEAITPVDIGSFSDDNVADALQRVAGVQIERNVDGVSGDRVSIRGIGPTFVRVTMNGRTPISAGSEGRSDMRKFNLNIIPTEIISGARIHKTSQAKEVSTAIGGTVDFQTIRPLNQRYKNGKNYFGSINARGSSNTEFADIEMNPRISGVFGGKINDKIGAAVSLIYADEKFFREEAAMRGYRSLDFREDTNNDGIFNTADGDQLYEDILIPATHNNNTINDNRERKGLSTAIQYKANDKLEFLLDYTFTQIKNDSDRQYFQISAAPGGNNGLLGQRDDNFFSPGSLELNGNNLLYLDAAGASKSRVNLQNRNTFYDNYTTNNIAGLNTRYQASSKLSINLDFSYSNLDFFQNLKNIGTSRLDGRDYDNSSFSFDLRGYRPLYGLPAEAFDPAAYSLINTVVRHIRTKGDNIASRLDLAYDLNKKTKVTIGARLATTDFETREAGANSNAFGGYTDEQKAEFIALRSGDNNLTDPGFLYGDTGLSQWINTPGQAILDLTPEFSALNGGSVFDFDTPLGEVVSEDGNLVLSSARSYSAKETSFASYAQVETDVMLFNVPVYLNFGVRAINTQNESSGFTGVDQRDPINGGNTTVNNAFYYEVENSRWDVLPSFNANFKIRKNFQYRFSVAKGASRPRYRDMIPNNDITYLDPASEIFDPNSSNYIADLGSSVFRGTITSGSPDLKPYTAWMYDNTFEYYVKNGGQFRASIFYKDIKNYIGRQTIVNQPYPGEEALGVALPTGQEDLLFDISKPINITDAQLYGFEIGFNQHFTFLPGFAKGFGLKANYALVESNFDGAVGDATNGFPGTSKHNVNGTLYYQKSGLSLRFVAAYRSNYLSNLGGIGSTRADEAHYTNGTTTLGCSVQYKFMKKLSISVGGNNLTGVDIRRYIGDDTRNLTSYYRRNPIWKVGLRYKL